MAEPFHGGELEAVVVTVRASGELRHRAESWIGRSAAGILQRIRFQQHEISRVAGLDHAEFVQLSEK